MLIKLLEDSNEFEHPTHFAVIFDAARKPPVFMQHGDTIEIEVTPIGVLSNPVVAEN